MPKHLLVNGENFELPDDTRLDELRDQLTGIMDRIGEGHESLVRW